MLHRFAIFSGFVTLICKPFIVKLVEILTFSITKLTWTKSCSRSQVYYFTCGHEGRFNGSRWPVRMGNLDIGNCTTSVRARHWCHRLYLEFDTSSVVHVHGRWCHWRPSSKNIHSRGGEIRLHIYIIQTNFYHIKPCSKTETKIIDENSFVN